MIKAHAPELESVTATGTITATSRLSHKLWIWPHLLNLDAVSVALLWQQTFADSLGAILLPAERLCLALVVWIIYTGDRILDSFAGQTLPTARHLFYRQHRQTAIPAITAAACAALGFSIELEPVIILYGGLLSAVVALYLLGVHSGYSKTRLIPKELKVATLFSLGTVLVPLVKSEFHVRSLWAVFLFLILCLLNCASVEYREWQRHRSVLPAPAAAKWLTHYSPAVVVLIVVTALVARPPTHFRELYGGIVIAAIGLIVFHRVQSRFSSNAMRVLVDMPLLLPFFLVLTRLYGL